MWFLKSWSINWIILRAFYYHRWWWWRWDSVLRSLFRPNMNRLFGSLFMTKASILHSPNHDTDDDDTDNADDVCVVSELSDDVARYWWDGAVRVSNVCCTASGLSYGNAERLGVSSEQDCWHGGGSQHGRVWCHWHGVWICAADGCCCRQGTGFRENTQTLYVSLESNCCNVRLSLFEKSERGVDSSLVSWVWCCYILILTPHVSSGSDWLRRLCVWHLSAVWLVRLSLKCRVMCQRGRYLSCTSCCSLVILQPWSYGFLQYCM